MCLHILAKGEVRSEIEIMADTSALDRGIDKITHRVAPQSLNDMCIGFWSLDHAGYALVLCTNRDEFLSRPTDPAHWHSFEFQTQSSDTLPPVSQEAILDDAPGKRADGFVLSGIDTLAGGTWFGINRRGDVSLLTNVTEPTPHVASSRGHLCSSYLLRNKSATETFHLSDFVGRLEASETPYAGFNMLLLEPRCGNDGAGGHVLDYEAAVVSNGGAGRPIRSMSAMGKFDHFGCISNDTMDNVDLFTHLPEDKAWTKVVQGEKLFASVLTQSEGDNEDVLVERLFDMLRIKMSSRLKTRRELRETIMVEPIDFSNLQPELSFPTPRASLDMPRDRDVLLASSDIQRPPPHGAPMYYATRLSTVLLIRKDGTTLFVERDVCIADHDAKPLLVEQAAHPGRYERRFSFQVECS